ncbi:MAG: bifunctional folylpolyglutamate synthase/dihydrofolate synthase [Spirochaetes bacterium]|nr:bifunctional folylpolyglutamate synthase/dihydrofolate synthase [Spirochaetota bacterium]
MQFKNYNEALDFLYSFIDYETRRTADYSPENYNLARTRTLLERMGVRQSFKAIHVAGTKGKGTTTMLTAGMLSAMGFRTGAFTSPHLTDVRERITINGRMISVPDLTALIGRAADAVEQLSTEMKPTTFELFTAIAFAHFESEHVDWAVIETGMGGRLDSTNVVAPELTVITSISFDHMDKLGNTLGAIAREKAGIIKNGIPVISARQPEEAATVLQTKALYCGAPLSVLGNDFDITIDRRSLSGMSISYRSPATTPPMKLETKILGDFQAENIALCIRTMETLFPLQDAHTAAHKALQSFTMRGRLNIVRRRPLVFVDGAHNRDSMKKLIASIRALTPDASGYAVLFAPLADKDITGMLEAIRTVTPHLIISAPPSHKHVDIARTAEQAETAGLQKVIEPDFKKAVTELTAYCRQHRRVGIITGSLYAVAGVFSR